MIFNPITIVTLGLIAFCSVVISQGPITLVTLNTESLVLFTLATISIALPFPHIDSGIKQTLLLRMNLLNLPFLLLAVTYYFSPEISHHFIVISNFGWLLLGTSLTIQLLLLAKSARLPLLSSTASGGLTAIACVSMLNVAISESPLTLLAAISAISVGGCIATLVALIPPVTYNSTLIAARTVPLVLVWIGAFIVQFAGFPRHELASSSGAQIQAAILVILMLIWTVLISRQEKDQSNGLLGTVTAPVVVHFKSIVVISLVLLGVLQAASYSATTVDDLGRYWSVADSVTFMREYPVWGNWDHSTILWMDLPAFPALIALAFMLFGHNYAAALAPIMIANIFLPLLLYGALTSWGNGRITSFSISVLVVVAPPLQIYSLGASEPDAIFITLLAGLLWLVGKSLASPRRTVLGLLIGITASLLILLRPEGILYGTSIAALAVLMDRRRWSVSLIAPCLLLLVPYALVSMDQLGRLWPTNRQELSLGHLIENIDLIRSYTSEKLARVILLNDFRFPTLLIGLSTLFVLGSVNQARRKLLTLIFPAIVLINIFVTLSVPTSTIRTDEIDEFIRHFAYPAPVIALLVATGLSQVDTWVNRTQLINRSIISLMALVVAGGLTVGSLYILATPEEFHHGNRSGSLLSADIYVNAPELWGHNMPVPCPPCEGQDKWDFDAFRDSLFANYGPHDAHSGSDGAAYQTLSGIFIFLGYFSLIAKRFNNRSTI
tara:strand:- start:390 stop:2558 length:2169 start_codon:yes stop_codon:yes gene_type:complete